MPSGGGAGPGSSWPGDPNPQVNGAGLARLRAEGMRITTGVCLEEALALNAGFAARMQGQPMDVVKMAASLDGRSALHNGMSQWITGPQPARMATPGAAAPTPC